MSGTTSHSSGRKLELATRAIGPGTLITPDNGGILLEKETLKLIANRISSGLNRKLTAGEVESLIKFTRELPPSQFYQKPLEFGIERITNLFIGRHKNIINSISRDTGSISELARIDEITDRGTVSEYLSQELLQTSDSEHQFKWTSHPDRRGNAVIDRDRVNGLRSSPDNVASGTNAPDIVSQALASMSAVMNPDFIDKLFKRAQSTTIGIQSFYSITLPHRTVLFDSRNRNLANTAQNRVSWYINVAGRPGSSGDIQVQDTLQQVIRARISPFWIPVSGPLDDYYGIIDMYVHEFWQQIDVTEFLGSDQSIPTTYGYHFRFKIDRKGKNRLYLVPETPEYTFSKPVAQVNTITVSFRSPFAPVVLDNDRGVYTATYGNPTLYTLTSGTNHELSTGDLVYVIDFNSPNVSLNAAMNTTQGLTITRINDTQFTVNVDSSAFVGTLTDINVTYGSKRFFFEIEFISLEH